MNGSVWELLVPVELVGGCAPQCLLPAVVAGKNDVLPGMHGKCGTECEVYPVGMYLTHVRHGPYKHVVGYRHNLVADDIVIAVEGYIESR